MITELLSSLAYPPSRGLLNPWSYIIHTYWRMIERWGEGSRKFEMICSVAIGRNPYHSFLDEGNWADGTLCSRDMQLAM